MPSVIIHVFIPLKCTVLHKKETLYQFLIVKWLVTPDEFQLPLIIDRPSPPHPPQTLQLCFSARIFRTRRLRAQYDLQIRAAIYGGGMELFTHRLHPSSQAPLCSVQVLLDWTLAEICGTVCKFPNSG